jgi:inositol oxygenase
MGDHKTTAEFRNYNDSSCPNRVKNNYELNHRHQTVSFVEETRKKYTSFDRAELTIWEAMDMLNSFVDASDPDFSEAQSHHAYLTAEDLRERFPEHDWLHLCGLLHDMGKILSLPLFGSLPQWAVVGDTFPVGCAHSDKIVLYDYFTLNEDTRDPRYNTPNGRYAEHCGLNQLLMSWGHDEYLYEVLLKNKSTLPREALMIIRFHSFYAWHKYGEYKHLMNNHEDEEILKWVKRFNESDLYSKSHKLPSNEYIETTLRPYYQKLIEKYFPVDKLKW